MIKKKRQKSLNGVPTNIISAAISLRRFICCQIDLKNYPARASATYFFQKSYSGLTIDDPTIVYFIVASLHLSTKVYDESRPLSVIISVLEKATQEQAIINILPAIKYIPPFDEESRNIIHKNIVSAENDIIYRLDFCFKIQLPYPCAYHFARVIVHWHIPPDDQNLFDSLTNEIYNAAYNLLIDLQSNPIFYKYPPDIIAQAAIRVTFEQLKLPIVSTPRLAWYGALLPFRDLDEMNEAFQQVTEYVQTSKITTSLPPITTQNEDLQKRTWEFFITPLEEIREIDEMCPPPPIELIKEIIGPSDGFNNVWSDHLPAVPPPPLDLLRRVLPLPNDSIQRQKSDLASIRREKQKKKKRKQRQKQKQLNNNHNYMKKENSQTQRPTQNIYHLSHSISDPSNFQHPLPQPFPPPPFPSQSSQFQPMPPSTSLHSPPSQLQCQPNHPPQIQLQNPQLHSTPLQSSDMPKQSYIQQQYQFQSCNSSFSYQQYPPHSLNQPASHQIMQVHPYMMQYPQSPYPQYGSSYQQRQQQQRKFNFTSNDPPIEQPNVEVENENVQDVSKTKKRKRKRKRKNKKKQQNENSQPTNDIIANTDNHAETSEKKEIQVQQSEFNENQQNQNMKLPDNGNQYTQENQNIVNKSNVQNDENNLNDVGNYINESNKNNKDNKNNLNNHSDNDQSIQNKQKKKKKKNRNKNKNKNKKKSQDSINQDNQDTPNQNKKQNAPNQNKNQMKKKFFKGYNQNNSNQNFNQTTNQYYNSSINQNYDNRFNHDINQNFNSNYNQNANQNYNNDFNQNYNSNFNQNANQNYANNFNQTANQSFNSNFNQNFQNYNSGFTQNSNQNHYAQSSFYPIHQQQQIQPCIYPHEYDQQYRYPYQQQPLPHQPYTEQFDPNFRFMQNQQQRNYNQYKYRFYKHPNNQSNYQSNDQVKNQNKMINDKKDNPQPRNQEQQNQTDKLSNSISHEVVQQQEKPSIECQIDLPPSINKFQGNSRPG